MSIRNKDLIDMMERMGHYGESQEFKETLKKNGHDEYDYVDRYNPADGSQYTYAGDIAKESWDACKQEVLDVLYKYIKYPPYDEADMCQPVLKEIKDRIQNL